MTHQLSNFIDLVKDINGKNTFKDVGADESFSTIIELGSEKWAEISVNLHETEIYGSENLTDDDESNIEDLMDWIQLEIRKSFESYRDWENTLQSLKYA